MFVWLSFSTLIRKDSTFISIYQVFFPGMYLELTSVYMSQFFVAFISIQLADVTKPYIHSLEKNLFPFPHVHLLIGITPCLGFHRNVTQVISMLAGFGPLLWREIKWLACLPLTLIGHMSGSVPMGENPSPALFFYVSVTPLSATARQSWWNLFSFPWQLNSNPCSSTGFSVEVWTHNSGHSFDPLSLL